MKQRVVSVVKKFTGASIKRKLFIIGVVILVVFIGYKIIFKKPPAYTYETVSKTTITESVTETGNVTVAGEYDVTSPATGFLSEIYVKNGDSVTAGQNLFKIQSTATAQQQAAALAAYLAAKSAADAANTQFLTLQSAMFTQWKTYFDLATNSTYQNSDGSPNTSNRTLTQFTVAQDNWLATEAQYKNQQTVLAQAQASLNNASLAYQATQNATVTAPIAGTVQNLTGIVGSQTVAPNIVLILSTQQSYAIKTTVNEVDINKVQLEDAISVTFDAIKGKTYHGHVVQTDNFGTNTAGVITYDVFASIDDADNLIKPAMTANLTIITNVRQNVLVVSNLAIKPHAGGQAVQVLDKNNKITFIPVQTGIKGVGQTEILSGLHAGQKIILSTTAPTTTP